MSVIEKLFADPRLGEIISRCKWFDPEWQFEKAVTRCRTTPERFAAKLLDCAKSDCPAAAAIKGLQDHGFQPSDKSVRVVAEILKPPAVSNKMGAAFSSVFPDPFERPEKTEDEKLAEKLLKAHAPALERKGIFCAAQLMASEYWRK